ncbi:hypothetical protein Dimus_012237 [Dionaea muscipula]
MWCCGASCTRTKEDCDRECSHGSRARPPITIVEGQDEDEKLIDASQYETLIEENGDEPPKKESCIRRFFGRISKWCCGGSCSATKEECERQCSSHSSVDSSSSRTRTPGPPKFYY